MCLPYRLDWPFTMKMLMPVRVSLALLHCGSMHVLDCVSTAFISETHTKNVAAAAVALANCARLREAQKREILINR